MAPSPEEARARAEATVQSYCGWHVAPARQDTLIVDGTGAHALVLPTLRVNDVVEVREEGELVPAHNYEWSASGILVRTRPRGSSFGAAEWAWPRWGMGLRSVSVTLNHGYDTWPLDVLGVVERLAARALDSASGSAVLTQVGSVSYATGADGMPVGGTLTELERSSLDRYKLPTRP